MQIKGILLKDEGDIARSGRIARDVAGADVDRAFIGMLEPGNQSKRCRLAGAAGAQQYDEFAIVDGKREFADGFEVAEAFADVPNNDVSHGGGPNNSPCERPNRSLHGTMPGNRF